MRPGLVGIAIFVLGLSFLFVRCGNDAYVVVQGTPRLSNERPVTVPMRMPPAIVEKEIRPEAYANFTVDFEDPYRNQAPITREFRSSDVVSCGYHVDPASPRTSPVLDLQVQQMAASGVTRPGMRFRFFNVNWKGSVNQLIGNGRTVFEPLPAPYTSYAFNQLLVSLGGERTAPDFRGETVFQNFQWNRPAIQTSCGITTLVHTIDAGREWVALRFDCDKLSNGVSKTVRVTGEFHCPILRTEKLLMVESGSYPIEVVNEPSDGRGGKAVSNPTGISCGYGDHDCLSYFKKGSTVTLVAKPAPGYVSVWGGEENRDAKGPERTMTLQNLDSAKKIVNQFHSEFVNLFVHTIPFQNKDAGKVKVHIPATNYTQECREDCTIQVPYGETVEVAPEANGPEWQILEREGAIHERGSFSVHQDESVTVLFQKLAKLVIESTSNFDRAYKKDRVFGTSNLFSMGIPDTKTLFVKPGKLDLKYDVEHRRDHQFNWSVSGGKYNITTNVEKDFHLEIEEGKEYKAKLSLFHPPPLLWIEVRGQAAWGVKGGGKVFWTAFKNEQDAKVAMKEFDNHPKTAIDRGDCASQRDQLKHLCVAKRFSKGTWISVRVIPTDVFSTRSSLSPEKELFELTSDAELEANFTRW